MKKHYRLICTIILFCILIPGILSAQNIRAVDSLFHEVVVSYRGEHYREALRVLELLDRIYPNHPRKTGSLLMQGKCLYKLKEYQRALDIFNKLIDAHPTSGYFDDALYGAATAYYRMNRYKEAVVQLMIVVDQGKDSRLQRKAAQLSSDILDYRTGERELQDLLEELPSERGKAAVVLRLGQTEIEKQKFQTAKRILREFLGIYPNSSYVPQVEQLLQQAEELGKGFLKFGVILPLTGPFSEQGSLLLEGIQYAIDEHNAREVSRVELIVRDSEGNIVQTIRAAQELCENEEILAIIGELESDLTAAIAAVVRERGVVLLAPTAPMDGISSIGPTVFQVNGSLDERGKALADYASSGLGLKKFAVLAPVDEYGKSMRDAFVETVQHFEGEIIAETWYYEEDVDLGPQFSNLRETGLRRMIQDSVVILIPEEEWEDELYQEMEDNRYVKQTFEDLMDSTAFAVNAYDGIFLPVYGEDLDYVAPQLANYNIETRIFGGTFWHNSEKLEENSRYIEGAIFISDFYVDPSDYQYYTFRDAYRIANGKTPEKMEIYGYDTAGILLEVLKDESISRQQIGKRLMEIDHYSGIRGAISFNDKRINTSLRLLQFRRGNIIRIK